MIKKLYKDIGGECEYYIVKTGEKSFTSHCFEPYEEGYKYYQKDCFLTVDDIERASCQYGEEDAEFTAAMDDLQYWCTDYDFVTAEEKKEIVNYIENDCK